MTVQVLTGSKQEIAEGLAESPAKSARRLCSSKSRRTLLPARSRISSLRWSPTWYMSRRRQLA